MARFPLLSTSSWTTAFVASIAVLSAVIPSAHAQDSSDYIVYTNSDGTKTNLLIDRAPALYTGDFGDCMGGQSLINLTSFDAAYYADNMTVLFNMAGTTNLRNETVMLYLDVYAYGEDRFNKWINPCSANFDSLCPMNASVPISGQAVIPVSKSDVAGIPAIALSIPDFEGRATLYAFSNSSQTQIACFSAVMQNGASFSHPTAVGSVLGIFTTVAMFASFATAIYGISVPHMRTHYAHSLSVLVIFEAFQAVFFSGALSLNWPSVATAFWSNFAWSAGMIYSSSIISSINSFTGISGNSSQVGGAGSSVLNTNGGLQQQIYGRGLEVSFEHSLQKRAEASPLANGNGKLYSWAGLPSAPGLPLPGNSTGFAGELAHLDIPAADAFMVGFLWLLILIAIIIGCIVVFKWSLEALASIRWIKEDRLALFRSHWLGFLGLAVLRTCFIAFFMIMTLTLYQFSYGGKAGPIAIAVIVFLVFFVGALGLSFYACFYRARFGKYETAPDRVYIQHKKVMKFIPWFTAVRESSAGDDLDKSRTAATMGLFQIRFVDNDQERQSVHENADYTKRFGWLSARYRRTRWWFFAFWVIYQFVRACFIGGARASPNAQVFGLFVWEIIAFIIIVCINPFEGARNTALAVWMLGLSKVATAGLSIAFLPQWNLGRILCTVFGVVIIVIQGFMIIGLLILIVLGAISSYMSLTRNREEFRPHNLENIRLKYFTHLEEKEKDLPPPPPPEPELPKEPYFQVKAVHRAPKIEDEDILPDIHEFNPSASHFSLAGPGPGPSSAAVRQSRTNSVAGSMRSQYSSYGNLPYGARVHRASWSSREFHGWQEAEMGRADSPFRNGSPSTAHNSITMQPLIRPQASVGSLRPATPSREQQRLHEGQRFGAAR